MVHARTLGVGGWVRNRTDGTVEAIIQGPAVVLDAMCDWLRHSVAGARGDALQVETLARPCQNLQGFEQRPTV